MILFEFLAIVAMVAFVALALGIVVIIHHFNKNKAMPGEETTPRPPDAPFFTGGWCLCAGSNKPLWSYRSNTIVSGGFQFDGTHGPFCNGGDGCPDEEAKNRARPILSGFETRWLGVGGEKVGTSQTQAQILANAPALLQVGMTGIVFDLEGGLGEDVAAAKAIADWLENQKNLGNIDRNCQSILTVGAADFSSDLNLYNLFDYSAPMMYSTENSYNGKNLHEIIEEYVQPWINIGIDLTKVILTYQSDSLINLGFEVAHPGQKITGKDVAKGLATFAKLNGFAGILGWPIVNHDAAIQWTIEIAINEALDEIRPPEIRGTVEDAEGHFAIVRPE
jgi:hypothetical protein